MLRSFGNVLLNPKIGLMLIDFEQPRRLRVNNTSPRLRMEQMDAFRDFMPRS